MIFIDLTNTASTFKAFGDTLFVKSIKAVEDKKKKKEHSTLLSCLMITHTTVCSGAVVSHRDNANAIYIFKKIHMVQGGEETIRQINLTTHMKYLIMCPCYDWVARETTFFF